MMIFKKSLILASFACTAIQILSAADDAQQPLQLPSSSAYIELKNQFKEKLFDQQEGLMNREKYMAFIEPRLNNAEQTLIVLQEASQSSDVSEYKDYFDQLFALNRSRFTKYTSPNVLPIDDFFDTLPLRTCIQRIKEKFEMIDLDSDTELKKTEQLIDDANKQFYQELGSLTKAKIILGLQNIGRPAEYLIFNKQ